MRPAKANGSAALQLNKKFSYHSKIGILKELMVTHETYHGQDVFWLYHEGGLVGGVQLGPTGFCWDCWILDKKISGFIPYASIVYTVLEKL
jgi:hypothetical protein